MKPYPGVLTIKRRTPPMMILYLGITSIMALAWIPTMFGIRIGEPLLDLVLAAASALIMMTCAPRKNTLFGLQLFWIAYIVIGFVLAVILRSVNILDFAQAYKFVWYLVLLAPFTWAPRPLTSADISRLLNFGLTIFLLIYSLKRLLGSDRPTLLLENNFELIFLALLYYSSHVSGNKITALQTAGFLCVIALSGSRSAAIAAACALLFSYDFRSRNSAKIVGGLLAGLTGTTIALLVFESRSVGGIESIDRFKFFLMFLESTKNWSAMDFFLGADRLTTLPSNVCSNLNYWQSLYSFDGSGRCYSVILHSFNLRIVYDHGLIIAGLAGAYLFLLGRQGTILQRICVLLIIVISGLSVSALNNVFTALGIALFCMATRQQHPTQRQIQGADRELRVNVPPVS